MEAEGIAMGRGPAHDPCEQLAERLRFEQLISELSSEFVNLPAGKVDRLIEEAQRRVCEALDLDLSALWQWTEGSPRLLVLTHLHSPPEGPERPASLNAQESFPWALRRLVLGETLIIDTERLPPEAARDQASRRHFGIKSSVAIPLSAGEGPMVGVVSFDALRVGREWPREIVERLTLIAQVFANALERKRADRLLRDSEERLNLAADAAEAGIWELNCSTQVFWASERARRIFGYGGNEVISMPRFEASLHAEDVHTVRRALSRTLREDVRLDVEYRIRAKGGQLRWISSRGRAYYDAANKPERVMGVSIDITDRKQAEEALQESYREIARLKDRLQAESDYLKAEIKLTQDHGEVIGHSDAIRGVLKQVEQVAPTDSSVLIRGETGTGKELVAQAIHRLSSRKDRLMVKVNCAALPSALVESELFGREKGAFTGALTRQVGRFEVADGSTIFLDEIGELSLEVQAKLLRVLQEGQFERLGSPRTIRVDVRVIAASNRDMAEEVGQGRFREDLYYRLNVFPIIVPPLRDRVEDIPPLVWTFLGEFSTRMGKRITQVSRSTMQALKQQPWPGNIRELRNVIERASILTNGATLQVSPPDLSANAPHSAATLADAEREHILRVLEQTGCRIKGPGGAARILGLKPSTLYSRMRKLGIQPRRDRTRADRLKT